MCGEVVDHKGFLSVETKFVRDFWWSIRGIFGSRLGIFGRA